MQCGLDLSEKYWVLKHTDGPVSNVTPALLPQYAANLIVKGDGTVRKTETCATIFNGPGGRYILGDNWMSVYPSVHIVPPGSVPTSAAPGSICFFGTVRVSLLQSLKSEPYRSSVILIDGSISLMAANVSCLPVQSSITEGLGLS